MQVMKMVVIKLAKTRLVQDRDSRWERQSV